MTDASVVDEAVFFDLQGQSGVSAMSRHGPANNMKGVVMKRIAIAAVAAVFLVGGGAAFAQASGAMSNDSMSKDSMSKGSMAKDAMGKDAMGKDAMSKHAMKKDNGKMKPDAMKKDDAMSQ